MKRQGESFKSNLHPKGYNAYYFSTITKATGQETIPTKLPGNRDCTSVIDL